MLRRIMFNRPTSDGAGAMQGVCFLVFAGVGFRMCTDSPEKSS